MSSCSAQKVLPKNADTKLVIEVEKRDFNNDRVTQYRVFANGIFEKVITHDTSSQDKVFSTSFDNLDKAKLDKFVYLAKALNKLDYENSFPWKEGLYDRGSVYKISFVAQKELEYLKRQSKKTNPVTFSKIYYYYSGHAQSPKEFKELANLLN